jgi:hypothetical protein
MLSLRELQGHDALPRCGPERWSAIFGFVLRRTLILDGRVIAMILADRGVIVCP